MIDQNKLKLDVEKWNKACRYLKNQESEMPEEEWSVIQFLVDDYLLKIKLTETDQEECRKSLQQLSAYEKYHIKNREIITQERELKRVATAYFLAGEEEFLAFKKAKGIRLPEPISSPIALESSASLINPGLLKQKASKLYEAYVFVEKNMHLLEENIELPSMILLLDQWKESWTSNIKEESEELIKKLKDCDRLHGNNREVITYSKIVRDIAYMFYCKDRETFEAFAKAVRDYDRIHAFPDLLATPTTSSPSHSQSASSSSVQQPYNNPSIPNTPPIYNGPSIRINAVEFASFFPNGQIMDDYGKQVFSDSFYLMPRIYFTRLNSAIRTASIDYKLYNPRLDLCTTPDSSLGYTMSEQIDLLDSPTQVFGFGSDTQGFFTTGTWSAEFYENGQLLYHTNLLVYEARKIRKYVPSQQESPRQNPSQSRPARKKRTYSWLFFLILLASIIGAVYHFWYKDYRIDQTTPRTFVYATNLFLRSSKVADVDDNRLGTIPYGSELITYSNENGWAYVKTNGQKGYVSSDYLLESVDFFLLNSVWGNEEAKELVPTAKYRLALLDYYKRAGLKGGTEWQLYTKSPGSKEDNVFYSRLFNKNSRFVDFAFLLKNNQTGERRFVLYSFDNETEQPIFCHAMEAPKDAFINDIICNKRSSNIRMTVYYSNGDKTTVNVENAPVVQSRTTERPVSTSNTQSVSQNQTGGVKTAQELNELGLQAYTRRQYEAALNYYNEAAKKGSDEALANLGWMTYKGLGTPKDGAIAISYLKDAVEMGNANACYYLGVLYENGIYDSQLFKDREESLRYYKLGADRGQSQAAEAYSRLSKGSSSTRISNSTSGIPTPKIPSSGLVFNKDLKGKSLSVSNPFRQRGGSYSIAFWTDDFSSRTVLSAIHPDRVKGWEFPKITFQSNGIFLLGTDDRSSVSYSIFPYDLTKLAGERHFICVVCQPGVYQKEKLLYIDGQFIASLPNPQVAQSQSACPNIQIGSGLHSVFFYIKALTNQEVSDLYQASK